MPVAFVLSGGASLGASQAGMLEAIYERGIRPDLLVGTSVGAINAAFIASRPPTVQTAHDLQRIRRGIKPNPRVSRQPPDGQTGVCRAAGALGVLRFAAANRAPSPRDRGPGDALIDLHVVAADVMTGEDVLLSAGSVADAVPARRFGQPAAPVGASGWVGCLSLGRLRAAPSRVRELTSSLRNAFRRW
jgi:NTE family protein